MKRLWVFMTFYDKILIFFIIIISVFFMIYPVFSVDNRLHNSSNYVIIIQTADGKQHRLNMSETYRQESLIIEAEGPIGVTIIEAHNGKVRVKEAPPGDPLRICEKTGWIEKPGQMIIGVPNKLSIWIEASKDSDFELDGISW